MSTEPVTLSEIWGSRFDDDDDDLAWHIWAQRLAEREKSTPGSTVPDGVEGGERG
jgi:hypothetical protein